MIFFAQSGLVSVTPDKGDVLWRYPFSYSTSTAASPVVADDIVYCSAAYGVGAGAVRVTKNGTTVSADEIWRTPGANMNHWATPVHHEGFLYGVYGQSLGLASVHRIGHRNGEMATERCGLRWRSLRERSSPGFDRSRGLVLVKPDSSAYTEVTRFKAVTGKCWNVPAISEGRIYVRSTTEAAAYDVSVAVAPKPKVKLQPISSVPTASFDFSFPTRMVRRSKQAALQTSASLSPRIFEDEAAAWTEWNESAVLTDGRSRLMTRKVSDATAFFQNGRTALTGETSQIQRIEA